MPRVARLVGIKGSHEGKTFPIDPGLTLGREGHNDVAMPDNRKSSRDHAKVWNEGPGRYSVADLGSTNGTQVNDAKISRAALKDGDVIQIGEAEFRFELDEAEKPKARVAPERPNLADVLQGKAKPEGVRAVEGAAAIEIKQRVLQYQKKAQKGGPLGWDVAQSGGWMRWALYAVGLGIAVAIFFVVRGMMAG
jgi:pSer/pThr/pTyr-binding forkhead associated (FHA) protein